jgi:hypothetical protein
MKRLLKTLAIAAVVLGVTASGIAQVQQSITFNLRLFDSNGTTLHPVRIGNKEIIENLTGTNVTGGKLWLVMPNTLTPDGNGNIGAFLRVTDSKGNVLVETTSDTFNIYQTVSTQVGNRVYAWNQFSLAFGGIGAELFGTSTWTSSARSPGGQGSFHCTVSGHCGLGGTTNGEVPCTGSIAGGAPKPTT